MDALWNLHDKMYMPNRSKIWDNITITLEEIDKRFARVSGDGTCTCGNLIRHHTHSKGVFQITGDYLLELCDGTLGHT